jgi:lipoate-protein ligase A
MNSLNNGRLVPFHRCGPAENMAIDQLLLESVAAGGPPTVRLYGWDQPTLSLGYFQPIAQRDSHPASRQLAIVRRATGGGAIVHHHELTYSVSVPLNSGQVGANSDLYQRVHRAMIQALADMGVQAIRFDQSDSKSCYECPFLCFMRRSSNDLIVNGYKVLGSAQRKARTAVLQHGSLILRTSEFAPELPGVTDLTGRSVTIAQVGDRFVDCLGDELSLRLAEKELLASEQARAGQIACQRFASGAWLSRR